MFRGMCACVRIWYQSKQTVFMAHTYMYMCICSYTTCSVNTVDLKYIERTNTDVTHCLTLKYAVVFYHIICRNLTTTTESYSQSCYYICVTNKSKDFCGSHIQVLVIL